MEFRTKICRWPRHDRLVQVGTLRGAGMTTKEIAGKLMISPKTVEYHWRQFRLRYLDGVLFEPALATIWAIGSGRIKIVRVKQGVTEQTKRSKAGYAFQQRR